MLVKAKRRNEEWGVESGEWENEMGDIKWENNLVFFNHLILNSERQTSPQVAGGTRASFLF